MTFRRFKKGDHVKYTSDFYGDDIMNPLWDGKYGEIVGVVLTSYDYGADDLKTCIHSVKWSTGKINSYRHVDIELVTNVEQFVPNELFEI